jgi:hypothetical protein
MDYKEMEREYVNWIHLDQDRDQRWAFVNAVMNRRVA